MSKKSIKTYFQFIIYFIIFGIIVSVATSIINYKLNFSDIEKVIYKSAKHNLSCKKTIIKNYIGHIQYDIDSIISNEIFQNYLHNKSKQNLKTLQNLFVHTAKATDTYFQVRFLSNKGKELIRIEKNKGQVKIIEEQNLQDKSQRYYFKEISLLGPNQFWYSNIDLNIENEKIEYPYRPTYRIAKTVYHNNKFEGIIIINVDLNQLLKQLSQSAHFDIFLIDKEGNILVHTNSKYNWSKYLNKKTTFQELYPQNKDLIKKDIFHSKEFNSISLEVLFKNKEDIKLILKTDNDYLSSLITNKYLIAIYLGITILLISIPVGMIIAISPTKIQEKLNQTILEKKSYLNIIDKYIITITTDLKGNIKSVSNAMCTRTGYTKKELLGKNVSIFKSGLMSESFYQDLWSTISLGKSWSGEIQNKTKDNQLFWLDMNILPQFDEQGDIIEYKSIATDISNKKTLEIISEQDTLTKLYNRLKIDSIIKNEIERSNRTNSSFSIILIDIDHFKSTNDTYGHLVGDQILLEFAKILTDTIRTTDSVGRWGGEEFIIMCTDTDLDGAYQLAKTIKKKIESFNFTTVSKKTASFGITQYEQSENLFDLLKRADDALYQAKNNGRNCIKIQ